MTFTVVFLKIIGIIAMRRSMSALGGAGN